MSKPEQYQLESDAMEHFLGLKKTYQMQRQPYENAWNQSLDAVYMREDNLDTVYEGRAQVNSPIMKWKVQGILSRVMKILFNSLPIARIEPTQDSKIHEDVIALWNKYIFSYQLDKINFMDAYRLFFKNCVIQGTSVAKIAQAYEERDVVFFPDDEDSDSKMVVKDDTYFEPLLLTEFYSDVNKYSPQDSLACIQSTAIRYEDLKKQEKRKEKETFEIIDQETNEVVSIEEREKKVGKYHNLDLLIFNEGGNTPQQQDYIQLLGFNRTQQTQFQKALKEQNKTGLVQIDECYGKYFIDGEEREVICTIANGNVVIQLEETPFRHKKYVRPFIVGKYEPIPNCLYGTSNVIAGLSLLKELNAARAQSRDANTQSIFPMTYVDKTRNINWDYMWRPNGVIEGQGSNGITSIVNPSLANVNINDSAVIQRDIDQLFSLSPVQEGTSDRSKIPQTKGATLSIIAQNDMPLNEIINVQTNEVLKPFIEMLYERDITFKDSEDLLSVYTPEELQKLAINETVRMQELYFDFNIKVLGNLELSNEIAHQNGYMNFLNYASGIPTLAKRIDWQVAGEKLLASFGIKDDAEGLFLDDEIVVETDKQIAQQQQMAMQQAKQMEKQERIEKKIEDIDKYKAEKQIDLEAKLIEDNHEVMIEGLTGQKIA